jgi:hypothetical protein
MKKKPIHQISFETLVAWGCLCGGRWMNEFLKGKSDDDLIIERQEAYATHLREMERQGF